MLVRFKFSNFTSFENVQNFSMEAGKVRSNTERVHSFKRTKLLKFMAVYGANAAGKSNIVKAFDFIQRTVVDGLPIESTNYYCKVDENNKSRPSFFEIVIEIAGRYFCYGFEVILNTSTFVSEWLKDMGQGNSQKTIFKRNITDGEYTVDKYFKNSSINERLKIYAEDVKNDGTVLFLNLMNRNKESLYTDNKELLIYRVLFNWFKYSLSVNFPNKPITNYSYYLNSKSIDEMSHWLELFGTGVSKVDFESVSLEKLQGALPKDFYQSIIESLRDQKRRFSEQDSVRIPAVMVRNVEDNTMFIIEMISEDEYAAKEIQFKHRNTSAIFSPREESDGTIRLLDLLEVLLTDDHDRLYIIDEINRRFHPLLTYKFVEEYLKMAIEKDIQLIVTTHESKLMDLDLLRKDEIAFVDKEDSGKTTFFSFDSSGERFDKKICKAYLEGEYKAIPRFIE